jgi:hypothetical protein
MDYYASEFSLWLFVGALPGSLFAWTLIVIGAALLRESADQPAWCRVFMRAMSSLASSQPSPSHIAVGVLFLALFNFIPVSLLMNGFYGIQSQIVAVVFLLVEGTFLVPLVRAILRTRARDRRR